MRKILSILTISLFVIYSAEGQKTSLNDFKNWKPRNIGPASMSGRITAIDALANDPETIYLGSASGGVWKTTNAGASWTPVFDEQPILNIGSVAIQQSNPNVVWVGTGEGNPRNSINLGGGIYRSLDAGKTWKLMGLEKTICIHRIVIDPTNPNVVYAGAIGNPYAPHPEKGVWKTTDGGETWSQILKVNDSTGCADLVIDPSNPNKLIANMWQFYRTPYSSKSGGPGSALYITVDGGRNWKKLTSKEGLPAGDLGRIGIAFARSLPDRVYAKIEASKNGFYKSDDGGFTWQLVNSNAAEVTDRPFYYQEIYVDPKNENRIYDIHSTVTLSEDGGKSFTTLIPYSGIHPDHHAWWINPNDPNFIVEGNDGGIGISRDRGKTWNFDEKIPVGQFYHINVDNETPYHVMGGMQDNGSWHGPGYSWVSGGIRNSDWENVGGGDGFDVMPDAEDASWVYSMSQQGNVGRRNWKTGESWYIRPVLADTSIKLRFNWNSAIAQDPFDKKTIYFGSQFVHKSTNKGAAWELISPDLTTDNKEQQKQNENGGLTLDITGAENYNTILAIEPSPVEKGVIWVGTDDGNVQLTRDGGKTWTNFRGKIPGLPVGAWIPQVRASRFNPGEVFVVANDYRRGDFKPYIFRTVDYGKTWTRLVDEKKVKGYALCILQDPTEKNLVFVGTEHGLWISFDNGASFEQWKNGYPSVSTYDLAIQEKEADLVIATFGRSLWVLDDIRPLRKLAANSGNKPGSPITVFPAPAAWQATYKPPTGYEWSVDGVWDAENKRSGAAISFYLNKPSAPATPAVAANPANAAPAAAGGAPGGGRGRGQFGGGRGEGKGDTVWVRIYNANNEIVRNLRWMADTGFNRMYWGMEEKGFRQPGSPKPAPGSPEPGGLSVEPGTYKVVLSYARQSDSTWVEVKADPRVKQDPAVTVAQKNMLGRLQKSSDKLNEVMDRLNEAEDVCNKMNAQLKDVKGKEADTLRKSTGAIQKEITAIKEKISGKTDSRQGLTRSSDVTVLNMLRSARQYVFSKPVAPGATEEELTTAAEKAVNTMVELTNALFNGKWKEYRKLVDETKVELVKEYKEL